MARDTRRNRLDEWQEKARDLFWRLRQARQPGDRLETDQTTITGVQCANKKLDSSLLHS